MMKMVLMASTMTKNNLHPPTTRPPFSSSERSGGLHSHRTPLGPTSQSTAPTSPLLLANSPSTSTDPPPPAISRSQPTRNPPPHTVHHKVATLNHSTPPKPDVSRVYTTIPKNEQHARSWRTTIPSSLAPSTTLSTTSQHPSRKNTLTPPSSKSTSENSPPPHATIQHQTTYTPNFAKQK